VERGIYPIVHNDRNVPIIMSGCIAHARNGRIFTSGLKPDVTIVFLNPDFLDTKISAICVQGRLLNICMDFHA